MFEILGIINRPRAEPSWSHLPLHVGVGVERGTWSVAAWTYPYNGQTSPLRPRLVVSHSTCPPLSPSPHAEQLCNRYCRNKHIHMFPESLELSQAPSPRRRSREEEEED